MTRPAPTLGEIEALAAQALKELPLRFKQKLGSVLIRVEDLPDRETEAEMGLTSPFDLLGLYRGAPLPHRSVSDPRAAIDMIFLYRRPILDYWCDTGEDLYAIVRHVLIHEIGHHSASATTIWSGSSAPDDWYRRAARGAPRAVSTPPGAGPRRSRRAGNGLRRWQSSRR